ncbi:MAG: NADPH-dependent 7-cyano-7-deazaguanine reductase QueF [Pseudomonadales bacterium]|nr:NADPH-dependent 7-cyano-7-deazaguanine reductase QueF [Pseudomonadales bacterium]MCP5186107.1 NADPH-dependent 7-cyano-7-deazaguanine reductase QueF [Pseudomonadales bacterium]
MAESRNPLGRQTPHIDTYTPSLLYSIRREQGREGLTLPAAIHGEDVWHGYEFTWLDRHGKPVVAGLRLRVPLSSPCIVESKSLKLYLNSFAQTRFNGQADVLRTLDSDLKLAVRAPLLVELFPLRQLATLPSSLPGACLDDVECEVGVYRPDAGLLRLEDENAVVHESVYTHLFRSLCPVTGQPDFATVWISYRGRPLSRRDLLRYLISFRQHAGFHESVVERIFTDLLARCAPQSLSVQGCFQRRGGLDINPFRSTEPDAAPLVRLPRQ